MEKSRPNIESFTYIPRIVGPIVQTPAFPTGDFGRAFYDLMERDAETNFPGNKYINPLQINEETGEVSGTHLFGVARASQLITPMNLGIRLVSLADCAEPQILEMIRGRHYLIMPAAVLRSTKDSFNTQNEPLARYLAERVQGFSPELPAYIRGFGVEAWPEDIKGYRSKLVPLNGKSFEFLLDDRFSQKYNRWKFTQVDKNGIPIGLTDPNNFKGENGRTWYTRGDGLSRVYVDSDGNVDSDDARLAISGGNGRIALVQEKPVYL